MPDGVFDELAHMPSRVRATIYVTFKDRERVVVIVVVCSWELHQPS